MHLTCLPAVPPTDPHRIQVDDIGSNIFVAQAAGPPPPSPIGRRVARVPYDHDLSLNRPAD